MTLDPWQQPLRIALLAPPFVPVPPPRYGGTERIVGVLAHGLHARGHRVTLFAAGDSNVECELVPVVPRALWTSPEWEDPAPHLRRIIAEAERRRGQFDVIHSHLDGHGFEFARRSTTPVVSTLHGRIDVGLTAELLPEYRDVPLVAISANQRSWAPDQNWLATIHHGLPFAGLSAGRGRGGYLLFIGRLAPEKGVAEAIELARRGGIQLVIAAKAIAEYELNVYRTVVEPAEREGMVRFLGEIDAAARDELYGDALATVMLGSWPEPFGLVAIESLAAGTPLIARRTGALPEIVQPGIDGFIVDGVDDALGAIEKVGQLDRERIRVSALARFSADRMVEEYEAVFRQLLRVPQLLANRLGVT